MIEPFFPRGPNKFFVVSAPVRFRQFQFEAAALEVLVERGNQDGQVGGACVALSFTALADAKRAQVKPDLRWRAGS